MLLCISGDYRSGKSGFGTEIGKVLGIEYYSMRTIKRQEKSKYNTDFVNWTQKIDMNDNLQIDKKIVELAKSGNCILDFRYAAVLCKKNNIDYVGIWISADLDVRVYGNSYCWGKTPEETEKIILSRERYEKEMCRKNHNADYSSRDYYQYFVDLSEYWSPIEIVSKEGFQFRDLIECISRKLMEENRYGKNN